MENQPSTIAGQIRDSLPAGGLFAGLEWKISPAPFPLGENLAKEIESLGRVLLRFYRATNLLYRNSVEGKQPEWIVRWLDLAAAHAAKRERDYYLRLRNAVASKMSSDQILEGQRLALLWAPGRW